VIMFWKKDNSGEKLNKINEVLKKSFANVKRDTTTIFQWLNYFYKKNLEQEQMINQIRMEFSYIPKTREEIRQIINGYSSFEGVLAKIRDLDAKINEVAKIRSAQPKAYEQTEMSIEQPITEEMKKELQVGLLNIEKRLEKLEQKKLSIKEKIIKRLTKNSKEYVKSVILSYIKKYEKISALQLKEIVVDEQNFCSKSSFYRLLEEIEELDDIGVIKYGKEKQYISKAVKRI